MKKQGVEFIDYVIASHYDEDHINGIIGAIHAFDVGTVIAPDYVVNTSIYKSFMSALEVYKLSLTYPVVGTEYEFGSATFTILGPIGRQDEENDRSVVVKVEDDGASILLTGDARRAGEYSMVSSGENLKSDLLVVGHHGSAYSTSKIFLDEVEPQGAIISCGSNNSYGHPAKEVMSRLQGIPVYRTDKQGDLVFYVVGGEWHGPDPCNDYSPGGDVCSTTEDEQNDSGELLRIEIPEASEFEAGDGALLRIEIPEEQPGQLQRINIQ